MADKYIGGAIFKNDRKAEGSKQPDAQGHLEIDRNLLAVLNSLDKDGKPIKMRIAGWNRLAKNGGKYLSILASEERPKEATPPPRPVVDDLDDEIPF